MDRCYISAIIPVYNTKQSLLERMIKSILMQKMSSFEIILIDDGSDEECSKYLDSFKDLDERIYVYHKQNGGVSSARNYGIKYAHGDYITFIDADDSIDKDFFEMAIEYAYNNEADIVFGAIKFVPEARYNNEQNLKKLDIFTREQIDIIKCCLLKMKQDNYGYIITGSPCGNLYKKSLLENVEFDENLRYFEDQIFNLEVVDLAKKVLVVPHYFYYYISNQDSAFHTIDYSTVLEIHEKYWNRLFDLGQNYNENVKHASRLLAIDEIIIFSSRIIQNHDLSSKTRRELIKSGNNNSYIQDGVNNLSLIDCDINFTKKIVIFLLKAKLFCLFSLIVKIRKLDI